MDGDNDWKARIGRDLKDNNDSIFAQSILSKVIKNHPWFMFKGNDTAPVALDIKNNDGSPTYTLVLTVRKNVDVYSLYPLIEDAMILKKFVEVCKIRTAFMSNYAKTYSMTDNPCEYLDIILTVRKRASVCKTTEDQFVVTNKVGNGINQLMISAQDKINSHRIMERVMNMYDRQPCIEWEFFDSVPFEPEKSAAKKYYAWRAYNVIKIDIAFFSEFLSSCPFIKKVLFEASTTKSYLDFICVSVADGEKEDYGDASSDDEDEDTESNSVKRGRSGLDDGVLNKKIKKTKKKTGFFSFLY